MTRRSANNHKFDHHHGGNRMLKFQTINPSMSMALAGALLISLAATPAAAAAQKAAPHKFKIASRSLEGQSKTICVIEGKWADGEPLRYETWDSCNKMHVRTVTEKDYKDEPSLGDGDHSVAGIPEGSEVLEFNNGLSTTLIFRDRNGIQREILIGD